MHLYESAGRHGDIDNDYDVDFADFALFGICWRQIENEECPGVDFGDDGRVDASDLAELAARWLEDANL